MHFFFVCTYFYRRFLFHLLRINNATGDIPALASSVDISTGNSQILSNKKIIITIIINYDKYAHVRYLLWTLPGVQNRDWNISITVPVRLSIWKIHSYCRILYYIKILVLTNCRCKVRGFKVSFYSAYYEKILAISYYLDCIQSFIILKFRY